MNIKDASQIKKFKNHSNMIYTCVNELALKDFLFLS